MHGARTQKRRLSAYKILKARNTHHAFPATSSSPVQPAADVQLNDTRSHESLIPFRTCGSWGEYHGPATVHASIVRSISTAQQDSPPRHRQRAATTTATLACSTCMYSCTRLRNANPSPSEPAEVRASLELQVARSVQQGNYSAS